MSVKSLLVKGKSEEILVFILKIFSELTSLISIGSTDRGQIKGKT